MDFPDVDIALRAYVEPAQPAVDPGRPGDLSDEHLAAIGWRIFKAASRDRRLGISLDPEWLAKFVRRVVGGARVGQGDEIWARLTLLDPNDPRTDAGVDEAQVAAARTAVREMFRRGEVHVQLSFNRLDFEPLIDERIQAALARARRAGPAIHGAEQ